MSAALSCTDQASASYLLGVGGKGVDGPKQQEGPSPSFRDHSKYIDKIAQGKNILVPGEGTGHGATVT